MVYSVNWFQMLTAVVALYGAALSTRTFIANRREKRRVLAVGANRGLAPDGHGDVEELIAVDVSNPGFQNVTVVSVFIELPNQRQFVVPNPRSDKPIPHELTPGTKLSVVLNARDLAASLHKDGLSGSVNLTPACRDALGMTYRGNVLRFDT